MHDKDGLTLVGTGGSNPTAASFFRLDKDTFTMVSTNVRGYGALFVQELQGGKFLSGADGVTTVTGYALLDDDYTVRWYYSSGNAWRVFLESGEYRYISSKITQGLHRVLGATVLTAMSSGYDWQFSGEREGDRYFSCSGYNETALGGITRENLLLGKFERVYPHGFAYVLVSMAGGDRWVSASYPRVFPLVSMGYLVEGYQSGPDLRGYTVNRHGIVELTNDTVKHAFTSRHEMPDTLNYLEGDAGDYYIYSKGSIIYNVTTI